MLHFVDKLLISSSCLINLDKHFENIWLQVNQGNEFDYISKRPN